MLETLAVGRCGGGMVVGVYLPVFHKILKNRSQKKFFLCQNKKSYPGKLYCFYFQVWRKRGKNICKIA